VDCGLSGYVEPTYAKHIEASQCPTTFSSQPLSTWQQSKLNIKTNPNFLSRILISPNWF